MTRTRSALLLVFTLYAVSASAQIGQGTLTGVVTDRAGSRASWRHGDGHLALSDRHARDDLTEVDGRFRMPQLPSGIYKLRFELVWILDASNARTFRSCSGRRSRSTRR